MASSDQIFPCRDGDVRHIESPFPSTKILPIKRFLNNCPFHIGWIKIESGSYFTKDTAAREEALGICRHMYTRMRASMGLLPQDKLQSRRYVARPVTIVKEYEGYPDKALKMLIQRTIYELGRHFDVYLDSEDKGRTPEQALRHLDDTVSLFIDTHKSKIEDLSLPTFVFFIADLEFTFYKNFSHSERFVRSLETLFNAIPNGKLVFILTSGWYRPSYTLRTRQAVLIYRA